ncbi:AI-2E family transporter [Kovacikia minuta CCNUW1]|uniref:AI-2E family transporter n=1 Tax=Kovacikia minuta TaxID=2931930 RepID=UPI001CCF0BB8|nr:AI-2E family transporter [Kovacikia minuta]UBF28362.1 AI-2E family transporter [Kovacikia minuta CCNUW1]
MHKGKLLHLWGTLPPFAKILLIIFAAPLLVINAWAIAAIAEYFHSLVVVLIGASLFAFLLNYPIRFMEQRGANRGRAAIIVFLLAVSVVLAVGVTLLPITLHQAEQLVNSLPHWIDSGKHQLTNLSDQFRNSGLPLNPDTVTQQIGDPLKTELQSLGKSALSIAGLTFTSLLDFLLTIVLSFYLIQHGDQIWDSLIVWFPAEMRLPFSQTLRLSFQNFFLGQLIMASSLGVTLTIVFLLLGVPFGLLFGLMIGTMALIPFGGTVGIALVTLLVVLRDFGLGLKVLLACVLVQQIFENLIAPRILGKVTGLNPFWVLLSILAGARIGGLLGVIVAVPIAVIIKSALVALRISRTETYPVGVEPVPNLTTPASPADISPAREGKRLTNSPPSDDPIEPNG